MKQKIFSCKPGRVRQLAANMMFAAVSASVLYVLPVTDAVLFGSSAFAAEEEEGRRPPPEARSSEQLTRRVYQRIEEVMEFRDQEDFTSAKEILDEIYAMFQEGRLNNRETQVMFQFYADIARSQEDLPAALDYTMEILKLDNLSQDLLEQTWSQVGSYNMALERFEGAIEAYLTYNEIALEPDEDVYMRLAYAYYQTEQYKEAIPPLLRNMELLRAKNEMIPKQTYGLLRALYLIEEDYQKAYQVVRESIILYSDPEDWILLAQLSAQLEKFNDQAYLYWVSGAADYIDSSGNMETLAQLLLNNDYPYGCAKVMKKGFESGLIDDDDQGNLELIALCYRQAREDADAVPFLSKAADLSDDGENYASLARLYMTIEDFESAVDAFKKAFDKGGLDREDQQYLFLARAYLELNRFDEAMQAAKNAGKDERSEDQARTWQTILDREKRKYEDSQKTRRELAEYF